jgi:MEMO1 family protein
MSEKEIVRSAAVAGMFYEKSPSVLRKNIEEMLKKAYLPEIHGTVRALVSPHAGYRYSGLTAAHAFRLLEGHQYECIILVGPSHREYFLGNSMYSGDSYETPLGKVPVNREVRTQILNEEKNISVSLDGHRSEHSLEVLLPFLQCVQDHPSIVPIIMGDQRRGLCEQLSAALTRSMKNRNILLIASSDLSHFHSYEEANKLDQRVIQTVEHFDTEKLKRGLADESLEACGGGPIAVAMETSWNLGAKKAEVLHACNSGDITGEKNEVVGYFASAFIE